MSRRTKRVEDIEKSRIEISKLLETKLTEFEILKNRLIYNPATEEIPEALNNAKIEIKVLKSHLIVYDRLIKELAPNIVEITPEEMRNKEERIKRNKESHVLRYSDYNRVFGKETHKSLKFSPLETLANSGLPYVQWKDEVLYWWLYNRNGMNIDRILFSYPFLRSQKRI